MIVDDDPMMAAALKAYPEKAGCREYEAHSGKNAIGLFQRVGPSLILQD